MLWWAGAIGAGILGTRQRLRIALGDGNHVAAMWAATALEQILADPLSGLLPSAIRCR